MSSPAALGDQPVVSAAVFDARQKAVTHPVASLAALESCTTYDGPEPLYLYPGAQPFQPTSASWALSEVLTCAFHIPLSDLSGVSVQKPSLAFEPPLSSTELGPGAYDDPAAPGAVPVVSVDGGQDQSTYVRPYRGAGDDNAVDQVTQTGAPIAVDVYENGPPLTVTAASQATSAGSAPGTVRERLSARVTDAGGARIRAGALTWSWDLGDGASSAQAMPAHAFARNGSYLVTVQVSDASAGTGGTATITVTTGAQSTTGHAKENGAGHAAEPKANSGAASGHGSRGSSGRPGGASPRTTSSATTHRPAPTPAGNLATAAPPATPAPPAASAPAPAKPAPSRTRTRAPRVPAPPRAGRPPARRLPARATSSRAPLVRGLLVSDVAPLPASASPLVHAPPPARRLPRVRAATRASSLAGLGAGAAALALLVLGAAGELRSRP